MEVSKEKSNNEHSTIFMNALYLEILTHSIQINHSRIKLRECLVISYIRYLQRKTNEYVQKIIKNQIGKYEPFLLTIKRKKLQYFGQI